MVAKNHENNGWTPTQKRMLDVLSDGRPHAIEELHACLNDELGPLRNIAAHLTAMRPKLKAQGRFIVYWQRNYQLVREIAKS